MTKNIKKINILLDENNEPKEVLIFREDGKAPTREAFQEEHMKLLADFAKEKGIDPTNETQNESALDFIRAISFDDFEGTRKAEEEYQEALDKVSVPTDGDLDGDEATSDPVVPDKDAKADGINKGKIAAAVIGGAVGLGLLGVGLHSCSKQAKENETTATSIDFNNATFEQLMSSLSETSERRIFFESVYNVTSDLNAKMVSTEVFALEEDGEAKLQFTYDEVMAAKLAFNNYSGEELKAIFGMEELNSQALQSSYQSFVSKMSKFAMNGKALSPVSQLIENEQNREWFVSLETAIVDFNKEVEKEDSELINEKADKVIRTFAYFYNHGINGVDGISNDASTLNCIKNLALNMISGYYDANVEEDYEQYLVVSTEPGEFDDKYITNELSQVQKGEKLLTYKELAEKGVCTLSVVFDHFDSMIETLSIEQSNQKDYERLLVMNLSEVLLDEGQTELSAKLLTDGMTDEVRKGIEASNDNCKNALKSYDETMNALYENIPSFEQVTLAAEKDNYNDIYQNIYGDKSEEEVFGADHANLTVREKLGKLNEKIKSFIATLYNNRIRGVEKINVNSNSSGITKEEWDSMSKEEQEEYAKEHGTVTVDKEEHSEKVDKDDLTADEKVEAEKQEGEIKDSIIVEGEEYKADEAKAAAYAVVDVKDYCDSINISQTMLEDARDGSISYTTYINSSKTAMNNAMSNRGITNEKEKNAYRNAWNAYIKDRVDYAVEVKKEEDRVKEEALKEIEEANKQNSSNKEDNSYNDIYDEEEDYVQETASNDEDYWLDDPQLAPPVDGDDIPIVEEPVAPVSYDYDSYVAATLLALEEAHHQEEVSNQKVKTI